jgi:hypothetical protein
MSLTGECPPDLLGTPWLLIEMCAWSLVTDASVGCLQGLHQIAPSTTGDVHGDSKPRRAGGRPTKCDLFPLRQRQTPTPQASAPTRSNPARRSQPTTAVFTIAAGRDRGIVNELPSRHASPEHLINLRNHPIRKPHTTPPTRDVAITARTQAPGMWDTYSISPVRLSTSGTEPGDGLGLGGR